MSAYEKLDEQKQFACRVIADHARATAFSIADGILPANEGRNYVLRKIMRRAIYQGRHTLGFEGLFFHQVTNFVVDQMGEAYPELVTHRDFIDKMVRLEEERFGSTLTVGLKKLDELLRAINLVERGEVRVVPSKEVAKLYDTFGLPLDLIYVILAQGNYLLSYLTDDPTTTGFDEVASMTEEDFRRGMEKQIKRLQQRELDKGTTEDIKTRTKPIYSTVANRVTSLFRGYETTRTDDGKVLALIKGDEEVETLSESDEGEVILDHSPFYAESGGQVGDTGSIVSPPAHAGGTALIATVTDTNSPAQGLIVHKVKVEKGTLKVGDTVTAEVDVEKRDATRRNHTATHLVHAALREVLGGHVKQAGSVVHPNYLRFDFNHYQPLTDDEIKEVERLVNEQVLRNVKVDTDIMPVEDAIRGGAMALFGEKYSGMMRVLTVPGFSKELCGGTHVRATGDIGVFKITSDESIASGVRRIRAITGIDAYERFREDEKLIEETVANLRTSRAELPNVISKLQDELKKARREVEELKLKIA
ncbi:MAG: alanine--tRNA ligase-related protein, partial [Pyrinomonadaceae bacterium]